MDNDTLDPQNEAPVVDDAMAEEAAAVVLPATTDLARIYVRRGGSESGEFFEFRPPAILGRFDPEVGPIEVDLGDLPEASYISRKHARITCDDGVWKIHDLGSSNGTYILNDDFEKVAEAEITDGQGFALGNAQFVFRIQFEG